MWKLILNLLLLRSRSTGELIRDQAKFEHERKLKDEEFEMEQSLYTAPLSSLQEIIRLAQQSI
jgi:hypothetical protein